MSRAERLRADWALTSDDRPKRKLQAAGLAAGAGVVALWPYTSVIEAGRWTLVAVTAIVVVALSGLLLRHLLARRHRLIRGPLTVLGQIIAVVCALTLSIAPEGALFALIPTRATVGIVTQLAAQAFTEINVGTAPLDATAGLSAVVGIGFAGIALVLDYLVANRIALVVGLIVAVVGAIPMIVTFGDANVAWFVMLGVLILLLLRHSSSQDLSSPPSASTGVAAGVGAAAVALALVVTPVLPVSATWVGVGTSVSLNPSLRLGEDLRRPTPFDVITLATTAEVAPYLRAATLSRFDGEAWHADESDLQELSDGFGEPEWTEEIAARDQRTSILVSGVSSSWLPVPYPATKIQGVSAGWDVMPANRTVVSETADASGQDYTVTAAVVTPTLEQIRASAATGAQPSDVASEELPAVIADTAAELTDGITNDYDKLIAVQNWFRSEFQYSLDTPVDDGFDGTGADAVARFLEVRSGYCIHFAGAFALMAQTLDMPVRIVVGYLPGRLTDDKRGDEYIYSVSSDQLHAWPEVRFDGIGWVPFEPTASLGVPTAFLPATVEGGSDSETSGTAPSVAPATGPSSAPERDEEDSGGSVAGGDDLRRLDATPVMLVTAGILLVLLLPALIRIGQRMLRRRRIRRGDALTAWMELRDTLMDLGLPVSDADTPRLRGAALVRQHGVDSTAILTIVTAVERTSYARSGGGDTEGVLQALETVLSQLRRSVDVRARTSSRLLPRSLVTARGPRAEAVA